MVRTPIEALSASIFLSFHTTTLTMAAPTTPGDTQLLGQWFGQTFWNDDDDTLLPALRRLIQQQPAKEGDDKAHQQILRRLSGALRPRARVRSAGPEGRAASVVGIPAAAFRQSGG